ncbi:MAG TPA: hypothetical protein VKM94_18920 [Blastocatellia bacterium]|nr:hypothetical protein [Blastocatellia bacterium]
MAKRRLEVPWWLEQGTEVCAECEITYDYHVEYRCTACDAPLCPMCAEVVVQSEVFCRPCASVETGE